MGCSPILEQLLFASIDFNESYVTSVTAATNLTSDCTILGFLTERKNESVRLMTELNSIWV